MNQSALDPAGLNALHTASLWWLLLGVCTVIFGIVALALGYAMWHPRANAESPAVEPAPDDGLSIWRFFFGALTVTVATLLILLVADFSTARKVMDSAAPPDPNALTIQVIAHQWWWELRYPDARPSQLVRTANEIHVPVGRTVHLALDSLDVIHSFWIPSLAGKKDMIPGVPTSTWLRAERTGTFRGQCAEFCGMQHAHMDITVIVETPDQFEAWLAAQRQPATSPRTVTEQAGRDIFFQRSCVLCHRLQGEPASATVGPDLTHFASRTTLAAAIPNTPENLAHWIVDPARTKPGVLMPATPLSREELSALLAYLRILQ